VARATGAALRLLEVIAPIPTYAYTGPPDGGFAFVSPTRAEEARVTADEHVKSMAERLTGSGITTLGEARIGPIASTMVATAEETGADLIVMSTYALTGAARALLGSMADEVMRTAQRPVLLVHRDGKQTTHDRTRLAGEPIATPVSV